MMRSHYQGKLFALLIGIIFALVAVIAIMAATPRTNPVVTQTAPAGMVQVIDAPKPCNALLAAFGGCK